MRCIDVEALWDEYREDGEASHERARAHLHRCTDCRNVYEQFEGVRYCLTCLPDVEPPTYLVPRILAHIAALRSGFRSASADEFARVASPLGDLFIAWRESGISYIAIDRGEDAETARLRAERRLRRAVRAVEAPAWVAEAVNKFFTTWQVDLSRVDISQLTPFEQAALRMAAQIPPGQVRSYGWIAREIGYPKAARAVGQAMARNPVALFFPCHRVVDAAGSLHNYGYGVEVKARILQMEGYSRKRA
jgi:O-6-methylguanine DNA methyltransferase